MENNNQNQDEGALALISPDDLSLVENNSLNPDQLQQILKRTPEKYVKERPAKGGGKWKYVTGGYVKKCLNLMFGWDWDFEILSEQIIEKQIIVKGRLTCRSNGKCIIKMQYGGKDIAYKTELRKDGDGKIIQENGKPKKFPTNEPLDLGNDFKAAATDALKKCASEIGIAADIYNAEEFKELRVDTKDYGKDLE